ncbi:G-type lectin S-receptor-like serine/threonine-protein kinase At1g11410 [Impatiens glandulifera]|uniref:G-type lectin S-receptor-like serine/threonine-protein kinase At1g11410 n=1 Tax=Impatiens glandulifera TaxID=253017 RepID=UPI001FB0CC7D|nr:G-type lectin S-receptor-like serine/threonine-protein kinase At1g11410 [Impatiens glandulifera]
MIYLHQDSRLKIIHRDLKASNILLDDRLNLKISDFGMARIFGGDQMEANTKRVVGTYGYMSPEYAMGGLYSIKSDVFSFGVILLEIINGRKNTSYHQENMINLIGHAWALWNEGKVFDIIDSKMGDSWKHEEVLRCFQIGLLCVQELALDRPTMSDVAFMLCKEMALPSPKQPGYCNSLDTITVNNPLKDDGSLIVSNGGIFGLGFFSPGKSSTNRYVGIWYLFSNQTVVWVANRDNPVPDSSGVLSLDRTGNLVILSSSSGPDPVWSTNVNSTSGSGNQVSCQLLDTGNLKLVDGEEETVVWQSFDHPTDTWLPFMKLGLDRKTGLNRFLTSWKSEDDPGTGESVYKLDITESPELIYQQGANRIWRTGPWIGKGWVGVTPAVMNQFNFNVSFMDTEDEVSVMYRMFNESVHSRLVVNGSGVLQRVTWQEDNHRWYAIWSSANLEACNKYSQCGAYGNCDPETTTRTFECTCLPGFEPKSKDNWYITGDGSGGCVRKNGRTSVCGKGDGFWKVERAKSPDTIVARLNRGMGLEACREQCLNNCTCTAYASTSSTAGQGESGGGGGGRGCITWYGELMDTRIMPDGGQDLYVRVDAIDLGQQSLSQKFCYYHKKKCIDPLLPLPSSHTGDFFTEYLKLQKSKGRRIKVAYIIVASISILLALCALYWLIMVKRRKDRKRKERNILLTPTDGSTNECWSTEKSLNDFPFFDLNTIVIATDNFSISNKLGEGGFGSVYKGRLKNGLNIAVKRLAKSSNQGVEEFKNEVSLIVKLQHRNLVRLLGCCVQQNEKMLVYEYLSNKGLDSFIFDEDKCSLLDWEKRFNIILGIVKGMVYLHQDSRLRIIHRDLKTSNVLLDDGLNPKISDFGMAKIFRGDQMEENTKRVVGTYGYMSPEYAMRGLYSVKSDVFSFGVILLEIISGRKNNSYYQENTINLIGHAWAKWNEGKIFDIIDSRMGDSWPREEVLRSFQIGLLCVQEQAFERPTMSDVAFMLCREMDLPAPKQPAFIFEKHDMNVLHSSTSFKASSINNMTITQINDEEKCSQLNWEKRYNIILGIAKGMVYLHQDSRLRIIHNDLKTSNVLLDNEFNLKISDFGMARIFKENKNEANTIRVVGTIDAYEEVLASTLNESDIEQFSVPNYTVIRIFSTCRIDIAVKRLAKNSDQGLGIMERRPTMSDVAFMLCKEMALPSPKQPAFILNGYKMNVLESPTCVKVISFNNLTITEINALAIGVLLMVYWFIMVKRRKERKIKERQILLTPANSSSIEPSTTGNPFEDFPFFELSIIVAATNNFSISNKLGQGGFGTVYKGCLKDGVEIAVKRLSKSSHQGVEEFKNEVSLIAKLQHRNLVRLLGCCVEHHEMVLVYEYLPNKGLASFIFDEEKCSQLNWEKRYIVILGIAKGMVCLHQDSRLRIIHRDLKASNVLLDNELNPKISDFGMARIFNENQNEANTIRVVGTIGYMPPEYAMGGLYSIRSDVFSFGVVLLEVISGRKNNSYYRENTINLIGHAWELWKEGQALDIIDSRMGDLWPNQEVLRCIHIGLLCVQEHAMDRPTMSEVVFMLCKEMSLPSPKQPAFIFNGQDMNASDSSTSIKVNSINNLSITEIIAR